jgi:hypothetical protein
MRDFAIHLSHRAGELARVADALSRTGVNIKSVAALAVDSQVLLRLIPDDVDAARSGLREANIRFEENEVITVLLENKAGELANVTAKLAQAGVNLLAAYVTGVESGLIELAVVPDDVKKAKKVLD